MLSRLRRMLLRRNLFCSPRHGSLRARNRHVLRHYRMLAHRRVRVHHRLAVEPQIHGFDAARRRAPLGHIVDQRLILGLKVAVAEVHQDGRIRVAPGLR